MDRLRAARIAQRVASSARSAGVKESREGRFAVSAEEVARHLVKFLRAKYVIDAAYRSFADRVKGPWRDSLYAHMAEHAGEERQAAYDIAMRIVGMGGDPQVGVVAVPPCAPDVASLMRCLAELELAAVENGRELIRLAGDNTAMKVFGENLVLQDTQHLDDIRRWTAGAATGSPEEVAVYGWEGSEDG
jgi:bacterioferritin (cytochrome b1)